MSKSNPETEQLVAWILHKSKSLTLDEIDPNIFASYVKSLVQREVPVEAMKSNLEDFIPPDQAKSFAEELMRRYKQKNFQFEEEKPQVKAEAAPKPKKEETPKKAVEATKSETKKFADVKREEPRKMVEVKREEPRKMVEVKKEEPRKMVEVKREEPRRMVEVKKEEPRRMVEVKKEEPRKMVEVKREDSKKKYDDYKQGKHQNDYPKKDGGQKRNDIKIVSKKSRSFSSDDSEASEEERDTQELSIINDDDGDFNPRVVKERFIVFVAGLEDEFNTIGRIYKAFQKFGRIAGIQEDKTHSVCFIEYAKFSSAYRAVKKGADSLGNKMLRVEFASAPNPDAIAAFEKEIEEKRIEWSLAHQEPAATAAPPPQQPVQTTQETKTQTLEEEMQDLLTKQVDYYESLPEDSIAQKHELLEGINYLKEQIRQMKQ